MQYPFHHCVQRGWAGVIPYEDTLAIISHSTKCSEGVADLVSDSFFWFLIRGLVWFLIHGSWCLIRNS